MTSTQARPTGSPGPEPAPAGPFRNPIMRAIVGSETISSLGSQMTFLVLPWFVLITTGSVTRMSLVFAVELLPVALLGVPSGSLVQRLGVRRTLLIGDAARALLIALIPVLQTLHELSYGLLMLVVFGVGVFTGPYVAAQRLVLPEMFGDDETMMMTGNALLESATRVTSLVGPATAGVLIGILGSVHVLWIDVASFLISFGLLAVRLPQPRTPLAEQDSGGVLAGMRFVLGHPLLRRVTAASLIFGLFFPMLLASIPVVADRSFGVDPTVAGLLFAAWGAGAMIGLFGVMQFAAKLPPLRMGALAAIALALPLWLLVLPLNPWELGAVLLVSGIFTPMLNAPLITLLMLRTPPELRPKAITFVMTANLLAGPAGYALAGQIFQHWGLHNLYLLVAGGVSVAAVLMTTIVKVSAGEPEQGQEQGQEIEALLPAGPTAQEPGLDPLAAELQSLLDAEVVAHGGPSAEADPAAPLREPAEGGPARPEADAD
jgi:MFS family permease